VCDALAAERPDWKERHGRSFPMPRVTAQTLNVSVDIMDAKRRARQDEVKEKPYDCSTCDKRYKV